jgi:predicted nucleic acid-binding protein
LIIVDTSVLVNLFRGIRTAATDRLRQMEADDIPFMIPVVCCQELLQGAKNEQEWSLLEQYLSTQRLLWPRDAWPAHINAARIYFDCRRRGITVRSSVDCLIAQLVLDENATLLHEDEDFEKICKVRKLRTLQK